MKKLTLALLLLAAFNHVQADNLLQNGDFSDGIAHWYGSCRTPADMTSDDSSYQNPGSANALVVKLRNGDWTKVTQDFETKPGVITLSVTYVLSPDLKFSQRPDDYANTTGAIGFTAWRSFSTEVGQWVVMMCDLAAGHANVFTINGKQTGAPQTFTASFNGKSGEKKNLCLAFPPGQGFVTLQNIALTPSQSNVAP